MKKVLSLLVAFVFLQVQSWALSGGPQYGGNKGNPSIIGTYGGVLIPTGTQTATGTPSTSFQAASIGIFSLSIPQTDISIGIAIVFVQGVAFIGQMAGVSDADKQTVQGVIAGQSNFLVAVPTFNPVTGVTTFTNYPVDAQGSFKASVIEGDAGAFTQAPAGSGNGTGSSSSSSGNLPAEVGATNAARLTGSAQIGTFFLIDTFTGEPLVNVITNYSIDGIKQSNIPSNVTTIPFSFSGGSTGS